MKLVSKAVVAAVVVWGASLYADDARIDLDATNDGVNLQTVKAPDNGSADNASWMDDAKNKQYIHTGIPATGEWTQGSFSFKADKDGKVTIKLMGEWRPKDENKPDDLEPVWILYDDIDVKGAELKNGGFDGSMDGWDSYGEPQYVGDQGHQKPGAMKVWHNSPAVQEITVKGGQDVTISFWYKTAK
ncbi:MAG: hypothetical protein A3K19_31580 [Lentisphaerae bacterium RIFOXYB12_FULL_65_16]|nr:MAG: hypothetical protein A3K18_03885 [Lentisphaerae bacterium RIFOXYA12_64_32]OGV88645.1 MAG: hypothetical protein A3K19_31580 [Lentisphaerae bacterium RIFOXYB12_FULL_65_16]